jgi:hypothetical protein
LDLGPLGRLAQPITTHNEASPSAREPMLPALAV